MIYLHLGLHKTATTSLQKYVFPYINNIHFIGRKVGVKNKKNRLYDLISRYCYSSVLDSSLEDEIHTMLIDYQKTGDILISDEWFTSHYSGQYAFSGSTWKVKIDRIHFLTKKFKVKVFLTLRNPYDLAFSQYVEFHRVGINKIYPTFQEYYSKSDDASAFDYRYLKNFLSSKFTEVTFFSFEEITNPEKMKILLTSFFSVNFVNGFGIDINIKKKNKLGIQFTNVKRRKNFLTSNLPTSFKRRLSNNRFFKNYSNLFLTHKKSFFVAYPNNTIKEEFNKLFTDSINFYSNLKN